MADTLKFPSSRQPLVNERREIDPVWYKSMLLLQDKVAPATGLTAQLTTITHTSPGTPDYALQNLSAGGFGFATADEGNTVLSVIRNLQVRLAEIEAWAEARGFIAPN